MFLNEIRIRSNDTAAMFETDHCISNHFPGARGDSGDSGLLGAFGYTGQRGLPGEFGPKGRQGDTGNNNNLLPIKQWPLGVCKVNK